MHEWTNVFSNCSGGGHALEDRRPISPSICMQRAVPCRGEEESGEGGAVLLALRALWGIPLSGQSLLKTCGFGPKQWSELPTHALGIPPITIPKGLEENTSEMISVYGGPFVLFWSHPPKSILSNVYSGYMALGAFRVRTKTRDFPGFSLNYPGCLCFAFGKLPEPLGLQTLMW